MKKILIFALVALMVLPLAVACSNVEFEISFMVDGEVYATVNTNGQDIIKMPDDPQKLGYEFRGWYWDEGTWQQPFTANSLLDAPLSSNMRVYAYFATYGTPYPDSGNNNNSNSNNNNSSSTDDLSGAYITKPCDTKLVHSYTDSVNNYFVYKIGKVDRIPLYIYEKRGHDGQSAFKMTTEIVEGTCESVMNSKKVEQTFAVSGSVELELKGKISAQAGIDIYDIVNVGAQADIDAKIAGSVSGNYSHFTSDECRNEITTKLEKTYYNERSYPETAPAGMYYTAVTCSCDVYVTIVCNIPERTVKIVYSTLVCEGSIVEDTRIYSKDQDLSLDPSNLLTFNTSILNSVDLFGNIEENKYIVKDIYLNDFYNCAEAEGKSEVSFKELYNKYSSDNAKNKINFAFMDNYDPETGVLTLYGKEGGEEVDKYVIHGMYKKPDSKDYTINTVFKDLSFSIYSNHDIEIEFDSFAFVAPEQKSAVYVDPQSDENINLTIKSSGKENLIIGCEHTSGAGITGGLISKLPTIDVRSINSLTITGYATMSITGGDGIRTALATGYGSNAIAGQAITVDMSSNVMLILKGGNGANGYSHAADDNDGNGSDGKKGGDGGKGGDAVDTSSFTLENGNCQIIAGNGGNGGAGSECNGTIFNKRVGGNGGNGGAGGIGITSTSGSLTVTVNGGSLTVKGGNGGNGGTRGGVHNHGEPGAQGKGGAAGVACMSGATVTDNTDRYTETTGKNGSEGTGTNQD